MAWYDLQNTEEIARLVASGNLEDAAYALSQKSDDDTEALIKAIVSHIMQAPPSQREAETELLAWLLNYNVIDPALLLQVLVVTRKYNVLRICGTTHFGEDEMKRFRLSRCSGMPLKHSVDAGRQKVNVNFKEYLLTSRKRQPQPIAATNKDVKYAKILKPADINTPESNEYTQQIRRLLLSSMSASEAVFRITKAFKRGSELKVAATVFKTCYESVTYNQLFGQVAVLLSQDNSSWHGVFTALFQQFVSEECDELDVDELQVCGSFFAHLLGTGVIVWSEAFSAIELDEDPDHASLRILVMAILKELKLELGSEAVTRKVLDPGIEKQVSGLLYTSIAPWFWEVAGFDDIAAQLHRRLYDTKR